MKRNAELSVARSATVRRRKTRRGLSLIESLVSLTISATLLTAVAAAYKGANDAVRLNDEFFRASQAARVSVNQVMAEVRKCQSGVVDKPYLELITATGQTRTYVYDPEQATLTMTIDGPVPTTVKMASNVTSCEFDTDGTTISMTVVIQVGNNQISLNGSAIPRRVVTYN
jgi:prepilin-type N-terminal cleavage/methylation domain-containing protein